MPAMGPATIKNLLSCGYIVSYIGQLVTGHLIPRYVITVARIIDCLKDKVES